MLTVQSFFPQSRPSAPRSVYYVNSGIVAAVVWWHFFFFLPYCNVVKNFFDLNSEQVKTQAVYDPVDFVFVVT